MRRGEILNLKWGHIDFEARIIKVVSERTKNEKTRHIPINADLFNQILKLKSDNGQSPFVFLNPATKKPFLDMKTPFKRACRISGIKGLRFHDLRHTFASRLVANGIDVETVRDLLGHHSILVTQRYVHSTDERKRKAVEILNKKTEKKAKIVTKIVTIENQSELIS
jgi:integrase